MSKIDAIMERIAEVHRKTAEVQRKTAEEFSKLVEENNKFSAELRVFKEENRIGFEELRKRQKENEEGFKELREIQKKGEEGFEKLRESLKETDDRWGKLVEALVNNQIVPLLQSRNIPVNCTMQRVGGRVNGHNFEYDIIAANGDSIVVFEVKTTLRVKHVKHFISQLRYLKTGLSAYSDKTVYAGVAFLHDPDKAAAYAEKRGLFTILATGSGASITNVSDFRPREF